MKRIHARYASLALTMLTAGFLPASGQLQLNPSGNSLTVQQDGALLSKRPVQLQLTEWTRQNGGAPVVAAPEVNTVGSIVETAVLESQVLVAAMNAASSVQDLTTTAATGDRWNQRYQFANKMQARVVWEPGEGHWRVRGVLENLDPENRPEVPVTLSLVIPIDDEELMWFSDLHRAQPAGREERIVSVATTAGARGAMSRYPFAAVASQDRGFAVGMPLDKPRIHRLRWDGRERALVAEIDITVSDQPTRMKNNVPFEFYLFPFMGEFAWRGASRAYYDLHPESFEVKVKRHGLWMAFSPIDSVQRPEDFHFAYHEYHPNVSVAYNTRNGIESFVYCEPIVQYVSLASETPRDVSTLMGIVNGMTSRQGAQIRGSVTHRADQQPQVAWVETPWAVGARVPTNGDPDLPRTARNPYNSFDANWLAYQELYRRNADGTPAKWNGGRIVDGVLGTTDRALALAAGESSLQSVKLLNQPTFQIRVSASGEQGSILRASLGGITAEIPVDGAMKNHVLPIASPATGAADLKLEAVGGRVWIDRVAAQGIDIADGAFNEAQEDIEAVTGLYLDSFEGWDAKDLNFRREHFAHVDIPLTFDARTGETAQVNMMHIFELADEARRRLHQRGHLLMANTALYQWCWSTHYLDVLGTETGWGEGATISPPRVEEMDYLRTMLYQKPYAYLQNLRYDRFRGDKVDHYMARCLHYGLWPGFFSHNAAEAPYWEDPSLYNADRGYFLRYMKVQEQLAVAGWEPIQLAKASDPEVMVERWGGGAFRGTPLAARDVNFTLYNPTDRARTSALTITPRLIDAGAEYVALDMLEGRRLPLDTTGDPRLELDIAPLGVRAVRLIRRDVETLTAALQQQHGNLVELVEKYQRHGFVDATTSSAVGKQQTPASLDALASSIKAVIEPVYTHEFNRAVTTYRVLAAAHEEETSGHRFAPILPAGIVPGEPFTIAGGGWQNGQGSDDNVPLLLELSAPGLSIRQPMEDGRAVLMADARYQLGMNVDIRISSTDPTSWSPNYETQLKVLPAVSYLELPSSLVFSRTVPLKLVIRNNMNTAQAGSLAFQLPPGVAPVPAEKISLAPGETITRQHVLNVAQQHESEDIREPLQLVWNREQGKGTVEAAIPMVLLPKNASVLRDSDVTATADSFYFGYDLVPLTDGILDTADLDWKEAAWASDEGMVPHWVEFAFETPRNLREVTVHWALDSGSYWPSTRVTVEGMIGDAETWTVLGVLEDGANQETHAHFEFAPQTVRRLRIYQPPGMGPANRQGIMWLREVEAR